MQTTTNELSNLDQNNKYDSTDRHNGIIYIYFYELLLFIITKTKNYLTTHKEEKQKNIPLSTDLAYHILIIALWKCEILQ